MTERPSLPPEFYCEKVDTLAITSMFPSYWVAWWAYVEQDPTDPDGDLRVADVVVQPALAPQAPSRASIGSYDESDVTARLESGEERVLVVGAGDRAGMPVAVDATGSIEFLGECADLRAAGAGFYDYAADQVAAGRYPDEVSVLLDIARSKPTEGAWVPYLIAIGVRSDHDVENVEDQIQEWSGTPPEERSAIPWSDPVSSELIGQIEQRNLTLELPRSWQGRLGSYRLCTRYSLGWGPCVGLGSDVYSERVNGSRPGIRVFYVPGDDIGVWLVHVDGYTDPTNRRIGTLEEGDLKAVDRGVLVVADSVAEATSPAQVAAIAESGTIITVGEEV